MRQIILDTETTGLSPQQGHKIIEIGCVEMLHRRITTNHYHEYIHPDRDIDGGAQKVHGISLEFLAEKPRFREIMDDFLHYIQDAELIIHNAPFDVGFLNHELTLAGYTQTLESICTITDTLVMARDRFPGQRNSLDALCKRFSINNTHRSLHGALLDSEILAEVYLAMTGGQVSLSFEDDTFKSHIDTSIIRISSKRTPLAIIRATRDETAQHEAHLDRIDTSSKGTCVWRH